MESREDVTLPPGLGNDADKMPQTPRRPVSPPRRTSSLAFNAGSQSPYAQRKDHFSRKARVDAISPTLEISLVHEYKTFSSPLANEIPSSGHVTQMQRLFQAAKASLHRDMFAASSPAGSIESRMNLDVDIPGTNSTLKRKIQEHDASHEGGATPWRYSIAPDRIAQSCLDVREPLPSPALPKVILCPGSSEEDAAEPVGSGFNSPDEVDNSTAQYSEPIAEALNDQSISTAPNEKSSSPLSSIGNSASNETTLYQQMTKLRVSIDDTDSGTDSMMAAPPSPEDRAIYLSPPAEAAARSAKAKRKLLKTLTCGTRDEHDVDIVTSSQTDLAPLASTGTNFDIGLGSSLARSDNIGRYIVPAPAEEVEVTELSGAVDTEQFARELWQASGSRATSTGSPMPFPSRRSKVNKTAVSSHAFPEGCGATANFHSSIDEHFQPGWYYAQEMPKHPLRPPLRPMYSFSTAASKIDGSDQAPASRIRDSYKTDTLTALAKPATRFRKNGIGAEIVPRGLSRYYTRPPSSVRPSSARSRPSSRQTYAGATDVRFRSSPPQERGSDQCEPYRRKRAMDDSYILTTEDAHGFARHQMRSTAPASMFDVGDQADAAVRVSIFGTNTPEALRSAREGIRELSPNVQIYRKGTQEYSHLRKKRRPSYWDSDLKEVRESPAGRGGVNSPVSAKASMRAEFEIASARDTEMDIDDDDDLIVDPHRESMTLDARLGVVPLQPRPMSTHSYG